VLRMPVLSYCALDPCDGDMKRQRDNLLALALRPEVSEAIYLASPRLHRNITVWQTIPDSISGQQIEWALAKYIGRMASWPVPFGLFAGVATGEIETGRDDEQVMISPLPAHRRRTRVDCELLSNLAIHLARLPEPRRRLSFKPNTSLAFAGDKFHYAEATVRVGRGIEYQPISVEPTPYLLSTLERARSGARLEELAEALVSDSAAATLEEAATYINALADAQLLIPDLGVTVTGGDPSAAMQEQLVAAGLDGIATSLASVSNQLASIDSCGVGVTPASYAPIVAMLKSLLTWAQADKADDRVQELDTKRVFHADLWMATSVPAKLSSHLVLEVQHAVDLLCRITPCQEEPTLAEFRRAFRERWEDREVPLVEALDEVAGIGFRAANIQNDKGAAPLAGTSLPIIENQPQTSCWPHHEAWLFDLRQQAIAKGLHEVVLCDDDLRTLAESIGESAPARLPDAMAVIIRLEKRGNDRLIWLQRISGPSGARLLGRLCHLDSNIDAIVREHVTREASLHPDVLFAEVAHLPEGWRTTNLSCRPVLRDFEIVYLGVSGTEPSFQISLDDLVVSVRNDRVVLRSRRLQREVVPRLSSNYRWDASMLSVCRFLAALEEQGSDSVRWSWGPLTNASWLPRVRFGRIVLVREQWRLDEQEMDVLAQAWNEEGSDPRRARAFRAVQALRIRRALPRYVILLDEDDEGDNGEFVDLDHQLLAHAFVGEVVTRGRRRLAEVFPEPGAAIVRSATGGHASEIILTFVRGPGADPG